MREIERRIARAIGNDDPATVAVVEDLMRDGRSGLDGLTASQFDRAAREAMSDVLTLAFARELAGYCETVGLATPVVRV